MAKEADVMSQKCQVCDADVSFHLRDCHVCQADIGFPNVRAAESEKQELLKRYEQCVQLAQHMSLTPQLDSFTSSVTNSQAVMIRSVSDVIPMLSKSTQLYNTFAHQISAGIRFAEDNLWDKSREAIESLIHPIYHKEIQYAVLSLNGFGANDQSYGGCHLLFKEVAIKNRSTVFEENGFEFVKRHQIIPSVVPVPKGYRATWDDRHILAVSKLYHKIDQETTSAMHQSILISGEEKSSDFIEVHIYGAIHISGFDMLSVTQGTSPSDRAMLSALSKSSKVTGLKVSFPKD